MWVHPDYRFLFAPARVGKARLEQYGITSHLPCIRAERVVNSPMAVEIHKAMASITTTYTSSNATNLAKGALKIQPRRMKWRGRLPWHEWVAKSALENLLPVRAQRHQKEAEDEQDIELAGDGNLEDLSSMETIKLTLQCPRCRCARGGWSAKPSP